MSFEDDKDQLEEAVDRSGINDEPPQISQDELTKLLLRYRDDFLFYSQRVLQVQTMDFRIIPFKLNKPQLILHAIIEHIERSGRLVRVVGLKARRMGFSTYFSGRFYHKVSWNPNRNCMQLTHEPDATSALFNMVKRFYNFTPEWLRPQTLYNNTKQIEFNTKDGKGLNSMFRVATAVKKDVGSGQLVHYCHLSEVSKWPVEDVSQDLLTSLLQCVPDLPGTEIVFESTAKGIGGEFYDRFWGARYRVWIEKLDENGQPIIQEKINENADPENLYTSIFLPWYVFDIYRKKVPPGFELTADEIKLKEQYGIDDEQLCWRRDIIANKCKGSLEMFQQEYPANPVEAFVGTGRPVFDNHKLLNLLGTVPNPVARYRCLLGVQQWIAHGEGELRVWQEPKIGRPYIISADVAEGLAHGDFSSADVIDHITGEQVAQWHGHCDADEFAVILVALGKRYNNAVLGIERNNHGLTVVTWVVNADYPNVYSEMVPEPPGKPRKRYGWLTNSATRPLIIDQLVSEVREDTHGIKCRETIEEMMAFKRQDNGKMEADPGRHDDRVLSLAIGKHLRQVIEVPGWGVLAERIKNKGLKLPRKRRKRTPPSAKAWT